MAKPTESVVDWQHMEDVACAAAALCKGIGVDREHWLCYWDMRLPVTMEDRMDTASAEIEDIKEDAADGQNAVLRAKLLAIVDMWFPAE